VRPRNSAARGIDDGSVQPNYGKTSSPKRCAQSRTRSMRPLIFGSSGSEPFTGTEILFLAFMKGLRSRDVAIAHSRL
jgi:hypothetical protein